MAMAPPRLPVVIGGGRCCRRCPSSSIVCNVFNGSGALSSFNGGRRRHGLVVSLLPLLSRSSAPPDPSNDKDDDKDNNDKDDKDNGNDQC